MKTFEKALFVGSTRFTGSVWITEPRQNEVFGEMVLVVRSLQFGDEVLRWRGHVIPAEVRETLNHIEDISGVSAGI